MPATAIAEVGASFYGRLGSAEEIDEARDFLIGTLAREGGYDRVAFRRAQTRQEPCPVALLATSRGSSAGRRLGTIER